MAQSKESRMTYEQRHPEEFFMSPVGHPRDRIIIHESAKMPKEGVFFALNGYSFLAKPGVEIDIPRPVRKMLDTRIETESVQGQDGQVYHRNIPRVTYTLVKEDVGAIPAPEVTETASVDAG